ncbi:hypothetical protein [Alloscardovia criceti]|uniref:hypothetical protein n=1 Tax=Alloscardovia criceti TaxID=356828 RepID=UPI0012E9D2AB|nr:hypothetical protein [Alloscardovia criceti]
MRDIHARYADMNAMYTELPSDKAGNYVRRNLYSTAQHQTQEGRLIFASHTSKIQSGEKFIL